MQECTNADVVLGSEHFCIPASLHLCITTVSDRSDRHPGGLQPLADGCGQARGARRVAVDAHRVGVELQHRAVQSHDGAVSGQADGSGHDDVHVVDDGAGLLARHQPSAGVVGTVGEHLVRDPQAKATCRGRHLGAGRGKEDQGPVKRRDRPRERLGEVPIDCRHVEEGAMRLDVLQPGALGSGNARDRGDLIEDEILSLPGGDVHLAAAEAGEIGEPGMGTHGHAVRLRHPDRAAQNRRVTGMKAGRDVRRGHDLHQAGIVTNCEGAKGLADVGVEVDAHLGETGT